MNSSRAQILDSGLSVTATGKSPAPVGSVLPARRDDARAFLREFTRELFHEISPAAKIFGLLSVAVFLIAVFYLCYSAYVRYQAQQQRDSSSASTLSKRIDEQEKMLADLGERLDQTTQQISNFTKAGSDFKQTNKTVLSAASLPTRLWSSYSKGTCLVAGSYILIDRATGRPLRYPEVEVSPEELLLTMGTEVPLTPEGKGIIFRLEFVATGFHVGHGYILTNRHIASEPWAVDLRAQFFISSTGATPRLDKLLAFFPSHRQPITSPSEQHRGLMTLLCARSKPHLQTFRHSLSMNNWEQSRSEGMWS